MRVCKTGVTFHHLPQPRVGVLVSEVVVLECGFALVDHHDPFGDGAQELVLDRVSVEHLPGEVVVTIDGISIGAGDMISQLLVLVILAGSQRSQLGVELILHPDLKLLCQSLEIREIREGFVSRSPPFTGDICLSPAPCLAD